ncbi:type VI secretion system baseplate subunit TssG [Novosphingobium sp.]|uniref:type VI secretion system baseplate subunit TssG n=1 Tax=Novosphingobium sp. TaxID=1874826 RepID=UPI0025F339BF|nr:type VI secretion system baseplate subunit TssG [Novosphingobium sp.]
MKAPPLSPARLESLRRATLDQAARTVEEVALRSGRPGEVGHDAVPDEEPIRFFASERMSLVSNDLAEVELRPTQANSGQVRPGQVKIVANILGLAGASPVLPPAYSELQLSRRRQRDNALGDFLNIFDHRALSFFYRITRKFRWPLLAERHGHAQSHGHAQGQGDPVEKFLTSLVGLAVPGMRQRLDIDDALLVTLTAQLADSRRSAASVESVLRALIGMPLRVIEACPVWMDVPASEQTRLGGLHGQFVQLGTDPSADERGQGEAAMIGAAVLDVQHHYTVEIGPLTYTQLHGLCARPEKRRLISQLCVLTAGLEHRPILRLLIDESEIPPLRLGDDATPALLGWTTWLGTPETFDGTARDCTIPVDLAALH